MFAVRGLTVEGIRQVTVRLGDHCAAEEIGRQRWAAFAEAAPRRGRRQPGGVRLTFQRKGFLGRQQRLLRGAPSGLLARGICALRLGYASAHDNTIVIRQPGCADRRWIGRGPAALSGAPPNFAWIAA
jgi:hypothetical protein